MAELESQLESHKQERYHMTSVVNANTGSIPVLTTQKTQNGVSLPLTGWVLEVQLLYGVYSVSGLARWVVIPLASVRI